MFNPPGGNQGWQTCIVRSFHVAHMKYLTNWKCEQRKHPLKSCSIPRELQPPKRCVELVGLYAGVVQWLEHCPSKSDMWFQLPPLAPRANSKSELN